MNFHMLAPRQAEYKKKTRERDRTKTTKMHSTRNCVQMYFKFMTLIWNRYECPPWVVHSFVPATVRRQNVNCQNAEWINIYESRLPKTQKANRQIIQKIFTHFSIPIRSLRSLANAKRSAGCWDSRFECAHRKLHIRKQCAAGAWHYVHIACLINGTNRSKNQNSNTPIEFWMVAACRLLSPLSPPSPLTANASVELRNKLSVARNFDNAI